MKDTPHPSDVALAYLRKRSAINKLQHLCPVLGRDVLLYRSPVMQDEPSLLQRLLSVVKGG